MDARPKNIVICSDGTANTAIKGRGTNVFKLFEAVDMEGHKRDPKLAPQIAFYDDGVGTEDSRLLKLLGGAFGRGLKRNVIGLYSEIVRVYNAGDHIYLFGFSRGAYTVRTLAGLISECGVMNRERFQSDADLKREVQLAYTWYRRRYKCLTTRITNCRFKKKLKEYLKRKRNDQKPDIEFIGVWDTVAAIGLPFEWLKSVFQTFYKFEFKDSDPSPTVQRACHAVAIDDERRAFHPVLWNEDGKYADRIEQVWFAGAHSDVGGGYPRHGLSVTTLDWMMSRAEACNGDEHPLRLIRSDRAKYRRHVNVHDKRHDPRSGLGVYYRYKPRNISKLLNRHTASNRPVQPAIHVSVFERIARGTQAYVPANIPPCRVIAMSAAQEQHAAAIEQQIRRVHGELDTDSVRKMIKFGRWTYWGFVLGTIVTIAAGIPVWYWTSSVIWSAVAFTVAFGGLGWCFQRIGKRIRRKLRGKSSRAWTAQRESLKRHLNLA